MHPEDNSAFLTAADEIRAYEYERGQVERDAEWEEATGDPTPEHAKATNADLLASMRVLAQQRDDAERALADHMATHEPVETRNQQHIAIQVLPHRNDLSYRHHDRVLEKLAELGVKRIRGFMGPALTTQTLDFYRAAHDDHGIKSWLTVGEPRVVLTEGQWDTIQAQIEGPLAGTVEMVAGWNEPNHNRNGTSTPTTNWQTKTGAHQAELWERFGGTLQVGSMQMWSGNLNTHDRDLRSVAPHVAGKFDQIVWHLYQPGTTPFNRYKAIYTELFGDLPITCSETGMSTAPNQTSGALSMTEEQQADYLGRHIRMYLDADCRVNWFELMDEHNPAGDDREDWLGIVRHDWTPKPAFGVLKALLAE